VLIIEVNRCDGCGTCVEVCPQGAISMAEGTARVDSVLCTECQACVAACPTGAIQVPMPLAQTQQSAVTVHQQRAPVSTVQRSALATVAAAALTFVGRHLAPLVAETFVSALQRRSSGSTEPRQVKDQRTAITNPSTSTAFGPRGRGRRHRRRGR
jgi:NAD-dependent dihydropyrimidine dehydrogenase PreA subunit